MKNPTDCGVLYLKYISDANYKEIALTGQVPAQEPHSMHFVSSILRFPSTSLIAPTGHEDSQAPQLIQTSGFIL